MCILIVFNVTLDCGDYETDGLGLCVLPVSPDERIYNLQVADDGLFQITDKQGVYSITGLFLLLLYFDPVLELWLGHQLYEWVKNDRQKRSSKIHLTFSLWPELTFHFFKFMPQTWRPFTTLCELWYSLSSLPPLLGEFIPYSRLNIVLSLLEPNLLRITVDICISHCLWGHSLQAGSQMQWSVVKKKNKKKTWISDKQPIDKLH